LLIPASHNNFGLATLFPLSQKRPVTAKVQGAQVYYNNKLAGRIYYIKEYVA